MCSSDLFPSHDRGGGASFYTQESKDKMSQKRYSQEIKDKMSLATKGKPKPIGFGDKISKALKGREITQETRDKISKAVKGKIISPETKNKMSKARSEEINLKLSLKLSKPILQYDLEGNFIQEWPSIKEAASSLNLRFSTEISRCCRGEKRQVKGYIVRFIKVKM